MADNSGTPPYSKSVTIRMLAKNYTVKLRDPNATVYALKLTIMEELKFPEDTYDLYYNFRIINEDEIVENIFKRFNIPNEAPLDAVIRVWLTVEGKDKEAALNVCPVWTVGKLKTELRELSDFPDDFELQHPDHPGKNLNDASTLVSVGVNVNSKRLFAIETETIEV
ncbi:hypothetical protein ACFE04_020149 [Oxalis oulophora]